MRAGTPVDDPHALGAQFDDQELVAVVCDCDDVGDRGRRELDDASDVFLQHDGRRVTERFADLEVLRAAFVADAHEAAAVVKPLGEPVPDAAGLTVCDRGLFPKRHREGAPARDQRQRRPIRARGEVLEALADFNEASRGLGLARRGFDLDPQDAIGRAIQREERCARRVRDRRSVRRGEAHEVFGFMRVPAQVAAVGEDRVDVADALMIGEEVDALAGPHRPDEIARERDQAHEDSVAGAIDPDIARGTAAVPFPARRIVGVAADDEAAVGMLRDRARVAEPKRFGPAAACRHAIRARFARERRVGVGAEEDGASVGRPAGDGAGFGAQERQPSRDPADGRHDVNFGVPLFARDEGDRLPVG